MVKSFPSNAKFSLDDNGALAGSVAITFVRKGGEARGSEVNNSISI